MIKEGVMKVFAKPLIGLATNPKAMLVVNVVFYGTSLVKAGCELVKSVNNDYTLRMMAANKIEDITKDELKSLLTDRRDELLVNVLTDKEKAFLKSVSKQAQEAS